MTGKYFRNLFVVTSLEGMEIDPGCLWKLSPENEKLLILVDDDQYITCKFLESWFREEKNIKT